MILLRNLRHRVKIAEEAKTKAPGHSKKASHAKRLILFLHRALVVQFGNIFLFKYMTMCPAHIGGQ